MDILAHPDLRQTVRGSLWLIGRRAKNALHVSRGVKNSNDLQRLGLAPIDDQIRIDQQKSVPLVGKVFALVADARIFRQLDDRGFQSIENSVGSFDVVVGNVVSDVVEILAGQGT